jgi:hypothetical protein
VWELQPASRNAKANNPILGMLDTIVKYFVLSRQAGGLSYADQVFGMLESFGGYALAG